MSKPTTSSNAQKEYEKLPISDRNASIKESSRLDRFMTNLLGSSSPDNDAKLEIIVYKCYSLFLILSAILNVIHIIIGNLKQNLLFKLMIDFNLIKDP